MKISLRGLLLIALLSVLALPVVAQRVGSIDYQCKTVFGDDYFGIAKWEWEGNDEDESDPGMYVLAEGGGVTITTPTQQNSGDWTSTVDVSGIALKAARNTDGTVIDPAATSGTYDNPFRNASSHLTFCGRASECEATVREETVGTNDFGAGEVEVEFTNGDGIKFFTFTDRANFNISAPAGWSFGSSTEGFTTLTYTGGGPFPTMVTLIFTQNNTNNPNASYYAVVTSDCDGGFETDLASEFTFEPAPDALALDSAYPNPFNPETTIRFTLTREAAATLSVYDVTGRLIKTLVTSTLEAGTHSVRWNGTDEAGQAVPSGLYLYRLEAGAFSQTRSMLLLK